MGKWAARLTEKTLAPPSDVTDRADERGFLSVLAVPSQGDTGEFFVETSPIEPATPADALDVSAVAWTDANIARFIDRRARLLRWGWSKPAAEALAERLVQRDRDRGDDRVSCADCRHYRPGRCGNHRPAGLHGTDMSRDFVAMLQRCPGFGPAATPRWKAASQEQGAQR